METGKELHNEMMRILIQEIEKTLPEGVAEDLHKMSEIQTEIVMRLRRSKAIDFEMVQKYNELCYKHFAKMQDGEEFHEEKPEKSPDKVIVRCGVGDERALGIVYDYIVDHMEKSDTSSTMAFDVFIVWKAKILQNWKYLISSTLPDGMYYELTYDGDKKRWYLDAYKKFENKVIEED